MTARHSRRFIPRPHGGRLLPLALAMGLACAGGPLLAQTPVTTYEYDAGGNRTRVIDPLLRSTQQAYDALNRLTQTTDAAGGVVRYGYDALDRLIAVTDPRNLVTSYQYNGLGDLTSQTSPDTGVTQYTHDAAGNVLTKTDAKGQVTGYQYDALNRLTKGTYADGSEVRSFYDQGAYGIGRLSRLEEASGATVTGAIDYAYDPLGRVTTETRTLGGVAYATAYQHANGRLVAVTYPSGRRLDYTLDAVGRISQVRLTDNGQVKTLASAVQYQPFGGLKGYTTGAGQAYARSFDADGRIAGYSLGSQTWLVGYDAASRITYQTDAGNAANTASYGYDAADRLASAVLPATSLGYGYDATGNRTTQTIGASTRSYSTSPTSNRLLSIDAGPPRSYAFDSNGSITNDGQNQYGYDARGRLISAVTAAGTTQYRVNALGQRVRKTNSTEDVFYHYDQDGRLIAESTPTGQIRQEYVYLYDIPLAVLR